MQYIIHQMSLIAFVTVYLICGGLLFTVIESAYVLKQDNERKKLISETYANIRLLAINLFNEQLNENFENAYEQWRWQTDKNLLNYIKLNNERAKILDNQTEFELESLSLRLAVRQVATEKYVYKWTYATAILYAVTLVTTIGYGNISPKTAMGKCCTIICKVIFRVDQNFVISLRHFFIRCVIWYFIGCLMVKISWRSISIVSHTILFSITSIFSTIFGREEVSKTRTSESFI